MNTDSSPTRQLRGSLGASASAITARWLACSSGAVNLPSVRCADNGVVASVGSKGDSYDNAMIESFNGLYKWELIYPNGPWSGLADVEFATLEYVDWFNHRRRHGEILPGRRQFTTPASHEANYRHTSAANQAVTQ